MGEDICSCRELEERLAPYIDGDVSPDARRVVDAHLAACPPCRSIAEAERAGHELLRTHRGALRAAAPDALRERCAAHASERSPAARVASFSPAPPARRSFRVTRLVPLSLAASLVLAIAGVFIFSPNDRVQALAAGLALDHVKCFKMGDSDHAVDPGSVERAWQQEQGWPLQVAQSDQREDLRLVCIRRCFSTDGNAAHVMYRWHGQPLSLYVLPHADNGDRIIDTMGHEAVIWSEGGRTYAVVAAGRPDGFDHIVEYVKSHAH